MKILDNGIAVLEVDSHLSRWIEQTGKLCCDPTVEKYILPHIPNGGVVIDGGASLGDHTIAYVKKVGKHGLVHAFEPNYKAYECLKHNLATYQDTTVIHWEGVGNWQGDAALVPHTNAGAARLINDLETSQGQCVYMRAIDQLRLPKCHFIKLDVEGWELFALQGAVATLLRCRPTLVIEINRGLLADNHVQPEDIFHLLSALGYTHKPLTVEDYAQYDLLAVPTPKH